MEILLALLFGVLLAAAIYLLLARSLPRIILGLLLLGNAANIAILAAGRVRGTAPPLVTPGAEALAAGAANPLPQALVLTAIVISFGLTAFVIVLAWATWRAEHTLDGEALRRAEPPGLPTPDIRAAADAEPDAREGRAA
ncbi:MAG: NADH-quinone oxidoreductase subunit K [Rubritepida sp.]|jgi:multisubunit Na+/H+ antiporter MnhC subunit|nr:NADH-quinone oxidoreductase subunit K [Rubritepida sp.]MCU0945695.1 NADH-quinone oxidoreductase subunit K [Rubritepida sp.]